MMTHEQGRNLSQDVARRPPASDERALAQITRRMEEAARAAGVSVEDLIAETLRVRAEIADEEFGEHSSVRVKGNLGDI